MEKRELLLADAQGLHMRVAVAAASGFGLDLLQIYRGDRDFTDALILASLVQSNSASRPISINAIAASLGLPFETVRRRIRRLIGDGACAAVKGGVSISEMALTSEAHRAAQADAFSTAATLFFQLQARGLRFPMGGSEACSDAEPPMSIVWQAAADYFLRFTELLLPSFASITQAFVAVALADANVRAVPDTARAADGHLPDVYRRPARASAVASRLQLPHETARRHLQVLVEAGRCERVPGGFIVPAAALRTPELLAAARASVRNLNRAFVELADMGVLAQWAAERTRAP